MGSRLSTVIVEPRSLVREALKSLLTKNLYDVVWSVGSTAELSTADFSHEPKLVVLSVQFAEEAVAKALAIRGLWPNSKIVLLYEHCPQADLQELLGSEISGCVPLFASCDTLIGTINTIATGRFRVMIASPSESSSIQAAQPEKSPQSDIRMDKIQSGAAEYGSRADSGLSNSDTRAAYALGSVPRLSEREVQVLDGLLKGHANKVIARTCDIAEATVKVHVKGILRKIRVVNRTQAAIWALESGYAAGEGRTL
jgi:two-component system nitrate/nitrite response regulator NarL